jgi:hypothetical protein
MNTISNDLKNIIQSGLIKTPLPIVKGKSTFIGKVVIRESASGYHIFDMQKKERVCTALTKHGALCVAKKYLNDKDISSILMYDKNLSKHENDNVFYRHNLKHSNTKEKIDILRTRLDISKNQVEQIKSLLEEIIFS